MALYKTSFASNQTNAVLVGATASRIILVTRIVFGVDSAGTFKLVSDPAGTPVDLFPVLYMNGRGTIDLRLGVEFGIGTDVGKALGLTSTLTTAQAHTILVWYEMVT